MTIENALESRVRAFIVSNFPGARRRTLDGNTPLLESGVLDSLGVLQLVSFLEQEFAIQLSDDELTPENFGNIGAITSFVEQKQNQLATAPK